MAGVTLPKALPDSEGLTYTTEKKDFFWLIKLLNANLQLIMI